MLNNTGIYKKAPQFEVPVLYPNNYKMHVSA